MNQEIIEQLKEDVKYILQEGEGVHDWDHTLRVYNLAVHIGEIEGADLDVLRVAALLHDIGRPAEAKLWKKLGIDGGNRDARKLGICHAEIGSIMSEGILEGYGFDTDQIKKIKYCIEKHRFSGEGNIESHEAKILFDADKIDNIGAIGILRAANYSGTYGARTHNPEVHPEDVRPYSKEDTAYHYYHVKLKKIKDRLFTHEARKIAEERHRFMKEFFDRVNDECNGNI